MTICTKCKKEIIKGKHEMAVAISPPLEKINPNKIISPQVNEYYHKSCYEFEDGFHTHTVGTRRDCEWCEKEYQKRNIDLLRPNV